jgi:hypothetical protein
MSVEEDDGFSARDPEWQPTSERFSDVTGVFFAVARFAASVARFDGSAV